jgi:TonB-linked SusC/RagA family outer membrane protein
MRFGTRTALAALLTLSLAGPALAQSGKTSLLAVELRSLLEQPARLRVSDLPLATALTEISRTSGVALAFSPTRLPLISVSCDCERLTVARALDQLLARTGLRYQELDGQIVILPAPRTMTLALRPAAGSAVINLTSLPHVEPPAPRALAEPPVLQTVSGFVFDGQSLRPLPGAQIVIQRENRGTLSDATGRFRIDGLSGSPVVLRVIMLGYQDAVVTTEVGSTNVRIAMVQKAIELDRVVVTGTVGGQQRRALGNAVGTVQAAQVVELTPARDVGQLLNTRVPGVVVLPRSGFAGGGPGFQVRGVASFSLSSQPLVYVDGIRIDSRTSTGANIRGSGLISRLNDINPEDIESIEVLKGPAAATLYGTEANSGVIQIITKRGRAGERPRFGLSVSQGASWVASAEDRFQPTWQVVDGQVRELNLLQAETDRGTPFFRTGHLQRTAGEMSGGSETLQYYLGGNVDRDQGVMRDDAYNRVGLRSNVTATPSAALNINASLGYMSAHTQISPTSSPLGPMFGLWAGQPRFFESDKRGWFDAPPEVYYRNSRVFQDVDRITAGMQMRNTLTPWLSHRLALGSDITHEENVSLVRRMSEEDARFFTGQAPFGQKAANRIRNQNVTVDYSVSALANPTPTLSSSTSLGAQFYRERVESLSGSARLFPAMGLEELGGAAVLLGAADGTIENRTIGFFVQQQFGLNERLFLTGALRMDDNSAFGTDYDAVVYPKASLSWVVTEEPFWSVGLVDALKLRAAYGASGRQPATFASLRTYLPTSRGAGEGSVTTGSIGNPALGPERGVELEVGFEAGLLNDRLSLDYTVYNQRTTDAILTRPVAPSSGFSGSTFVNAGEIQNWGQELQVRAQVLSRPRLGWQVAGAVANNRNEVISLGGDEIIALSQQLAHVPGLPVGSFYFKKLVSAELDPQGRAINPRCDGGPDRNHAPVPCAEAPRMYIGSARPTFDGSLNTTLSLFDRLRFFAMVETKRGHKRLNGDYLARCSVRRLCRENHFPHEYDPVTIWGIQNFGVPEADIYAIEDVSFVALREASVSYTLPDRWSGGVGASRASITMSLRNIHTWHNSWSWSPEANYDAPGSIIKDTFPLPMQLLTTFRVSF